MGNSWLGQWVCEARMAGHAKPVTMTLWMLAATAAAAASVPSVSIS